MDGAGLEAKVIFPSPSIPPSCCSRVNCEPFATTFKIATGDCRNTKSLAGTEILETLFSIIINLVIWARVEE